MRRCKGFAKTGTRKKEFKPANKKALATKQVLLIDSVRLLI
jgi:hypothetical protein